MGIGRLMILLLLCCTMASCASAGSAVPDTLEGADEGSWLSRNLQRYFGDDSQQAGDLEGEALEIVSAYQEYAGHQIEVVLVHQVPSFKEGWDSDQAGGLRLINEMTSTFQSYTRDSVIRDYLLFRQGEKLDPHALADSEVMLRRLSFINDVRLLVLPLQEEPGSVVVIVETTDRWPFGIKGKAVTAEKYYLNLYSENVAGTGIRFSNEVRHNTLARPSWGYHGTLSKENIQGTFLAAEVNLENSYLEKSHGIRVERRLSHPGLHLVGGLSLEHTDDFRQEEIPHRLDSYDLWIGDVNRMFDVRQLGSKSRPLVVHALRFVRRDFLRRPVVTPDSNRSYHDRDILLGGFSYQRVKNYKTSFLFADGETEDLPVGIAAKISMGYEFREFQQRTPLFLEMGLVSMRHRGDVVFLESAFGGYYRNWKIEEGLFEVGAGYATMLHGSESFQYRFYGRLHYTLGIRRYPGNRIFLSDRTGIRGLSEKAVFGNQRLLGSLEWRVFTAVNLWGFRFSMQVFSDAGMVGAEDSSSLFKEKIYVSTGLGLRLRNPSLVLPTVQLQLSMLSNVEEAGLAVGISVGNAPNRRIGLPGTKPSIPSYD